MKFYENTAVELSSQEELNTIYDLMGWAHKEVPRISALGGLYLIIKEDQISYKHRADIRDMKIISAAEFIRANSDTKFPVGSYVVLTDDRGMSASNGAIARVTKSEHIEHFNSNKLFIDVDWVSNCDQENGGYTIDRFKPLEIPEKWCIRRTPENAEVLNAWGKSKVSEWSIYKDEFLESTSGFITSEGYGFIFLASAEYPEIPYEQWQTIPEVAEWLKEFNKEKEKKYTINTKIFTKQGSTTFVYNLDENKAYSLKELKGVFPFIDIERCPWFTAIAEVVSPVKEKTVEEKVYNILDVKCREHGAINPHKATAEIINLLCKK